MLEKLNYPVITLMAIIIVCLYMDFDFRKWEKPEGVVNNDIHIYYGYLPAHFIYHDIKNEKYLGKDENGEFIWWTLKTPDGKNVFKMTMGLAILYAPFFFLAHFYCLLSDIPADGITIPYRISLLLSTIFYLGLGLLYLKKLLTKLDFHRNTIAITILTLFAGTNLLIYSTFEAPMPHVYNFFLFAAFIYFLTHWNDKPTLKLALILGVLIGLISLVRPSNAVILIIPVLFELTKIIKTGWKQFPWFYIIVIAISATIVWIPQFIYWKYVTGKFLYYSYNNETFNFTKPEIVSGLFSFRKGWITYTPIILFAFAGLLLMKEKAKEFRLPIILFLVVNIYIVYSWWCWWYGGSFGSRPMIESYAILSIPLAAFIEQVRNSKLFMKLLVSACFLFLFWLNVFQLYQYQHGAIHYDSMSYELYVKQFGKLYPVNEFYNYLDPPDLNKPTVSFKECQSKGAEFYTLRADNRKYLCADKNSDGTIVANRPFPFEWETFKMVKLENGNFTIQTYQNHYLAFVPENGNRICAVTDSMTINSEFEITILEENLASIKAINNKYLRIDNESKYIFADANSVDDTAIFRIICN